MSITFEYSFNSPLELSRLAAEVNRVLGTSLQPRAGGGFAGVLLGMDLVLELHHLQNDRDLNFESSRYQLSNNTWSGSGLRAIQVEVLVLAAFAMHETLKIGEGMLTYDAQHHLARYDLVAIEWCDTTTGEPIQPLEHLVAVSKRIEAFA